MNPNNHAIRHFEMMRTLAADLEVLPAAILEHTYCDETFGSWLTTIRFKGHVFRLVYDGRDNEARTID